MRTLLIVTSIGSICGVLYAAAVSRSIINRKRRKQFGDRLDQVLKGRS